MVSQRQKALEWWRGLDKNARISVWIFSGRKFGDFSLFCASSSAIETAYNNHIGRTEEDLRRLFNAAADCEVQDRYLENGHMMNGEPYKAMSEDVFIEVLKKLTGQ